jgi:hypothetical protein
MGFWDFLGLGGDSAVEDSLGFGDLGLSDLTGYALQAGDYLDNEYSPSAQPVSYAQPVRSSGVPAVRMPMIPAGSSNLSMRFPNLYTFLMGWRQKGVKVSAEYFWGLLKKYGPSALTMVGMSALAIQELMMYRAGRKRRRMNSLNPRALSRATRRLCSFQSRAAKVTSALGGIVRSKARRRHCFKCKRSPCAC